MLLWNQNTLMPFECRRLHDGCVRFLVWSEGGSRLVSGDDEGRIGIWKPQKSGKLTLVQEFKRSGEMSHCVFQPGTIDGEDGEGNAGYSSVGPFFFVGTVQGTVYQCDNNGRCEVAFTVPGMIRTMLYDDEADTVVVITNDFNVTTVCWCCYLLFCGEGGGEGAGPGFRFHLICVPPFSSIT